MACINCGSEDHESPLEPSAATIAWADQFRSEFRDEAREMYSRALAAIGETLVVDQETLAGIDAMFAVGANAMVVVLARHGALKRAEF